MKVLVTGGGGYIGTTLVPMLLDEGHNVTVIDRFFFGKEKIKIHKNLELITDDSRLLKEDYFEGIDAVIDLVAISNDPSGETFKNETFEINHISRVRTAQIAKKMGVKKYILPSTCSIYGFQDQNTIADENTKTNPLTTYAKANEKAEQGVLPLSDNNFCVTVLRQSTVYGYSPRMRFDLAINGMTYGAWKTGKLPLMRDGTQWRPMVHVSDTAAAQIFMLTAKDEDINGEIFNVGSSENLYQLKDLAEKVKDIIGNVDIEWYGEADHRSYRVNFGKIESIGFKAVKNAEYGITEILQKLNAKELDKTPDTITLDWYKLIIEWNERLGALGNFKGILKL
tara:strand:- start:636 stop:1652 length:1017 start_codon:yes stop_codon:yes gene_type:complete